MIHLFFWCIINHFWCTQSLASSLLVEAASLWRGTFIEFSLSYSRLRVNWKSIYCGFCWSDTVWRATMWNRSNKGTKRRLFVNSTVTARSFAVFQQGAAQGTSLWQPGHRRLATACQNGNKALATWSISPLLDYDSVLRITDDGNKRDSYSEPRHKPTYQVRLFTFESTICIPWGYSGRVKFTIAYKKLNQKQSHRRWFRPLN